MPLVRALAVAVVVAALAAGCASDDSNASPTTAASSGTTAANPGTTAASPGTTAASTGDGSLDWKPCKQQTRFDCATLDVPLDYSDPSGKTISLALIRKEAGDPSQRIGSLLMNPGGPGGSGVEFLPQIATIIDSDISDRFDLVSFDPRGVGESDPIVCLTDQQKDVYAAFDAVPTAAEIPQLEDLNKQFGATCKQKYGDDLSHFGTVDAARDMDRIREAVGDDKLTYLGFSYGTRLGSVYAQLFPDKVRALALDGAVDPDPAATDFPAKQAAGFEEAFDAFAKDCDANPQCPAGPDAAGLYDQLLKQVDSKPIAAAHDERVLTQGYLVSGVISALYAKELWSPLATGLRQAQQGDGSLLLELADTLSGRANDGTWNNEWDINTTVNCLDDPERDTVPQVESLATDLESASPRFGPVIAWTNLSCTFWPVPADPIPVATADGAPPIVVVGTTRDPATPYVWAERMASTLKSGVLITRDGDGHTGYIESPCVAQMVNDYLINLTVPPAKAFCAS
jgi:pimeloyl-ACP methyl ester carboxylesterase